MLDGRVSEASQVEYTPFGNLPLKRECPALKPRQAAEPPLSPGSLLYVLYVLYLTRHTLPRLVAICAICAIYSVRAKSVLYVLYRAI